MDKIDVSAYDTSFITKAQKHCLEIVTEVSNFRKKKILILEDERLGRDTLRIILNDEENSKFSFDLVGTMEEADERIGKIRYDYYILDMRIKRDPNDNFGANGNIDCGLDLVVRHPKIAEKTIVWSGYMTAELRKKARSLGVTKITDKTNEIIEDLCNIINGIRDGKFKYQML